MATFKIIHGFKLKSANKVLMPKSLYATEKEDELEELRNTFIPHGAAEEVLPAPKAAKNPSKKQTVDQTDDITLVKGIGAGLSAKLAERKITKKSDLEAALKDAARVADMKEILGPSYGRILAQVVPSADDNTSSGVNVNDHNSQPVDPAVDPEMSSNGENAEQNTPTVQ